MSRNVAICPVCGGNEIEREECVDCGIPISRFVEKSSHGGPNRGQGRKPKPLEEHRKQLMVSLPPDLYQQVKRHGKHSKLIQRLLTEYFERNK